MPLYEHVFISRQDLSNAQAEGLIDHFGTILADNGGKVDHQEYWGVKTMAYKINKNRKGHYAFMRTEAPAPAVQEMERLMRLHDDVMRVLTIKVDEHDEGFAVELFSQLLGLLLAFEVARLELGLLGLETGDVGCIRAERLALGKEEVARVAFLDRHNLAHLAELGDAFE